MKELHRITSPDGNLTLKVVEAADGVIAIGFEGGSWPTHPDEDAVEEFVPQPTCDRLPIVVSTDGGKTIDPWVSDNLAGTLEVYGKEHCVLRLWSGARC